MQLVDSLTVPWLSEEGKARQNYSCMSKVIRPPKPRPIALPLALSPDAAPVKGEMLAVGAKVAVEPMRE